jgi:hypothetical protein
VKTDFTFIFTYFIIDLFFLITFPGAFLAFTCHSLFAFSQQSMGDLNIISVVILQVWAHPL